ncbi:DUF1858 domain-containing protein [Candidatus Peregrinibacteria bacterium]|nr:DUF1858 domain-containing protein [Candidatus Peregrinibacteria bacterium]
MPILEIVTMIPEAKSVLAEYGLHCFSCLGNETENLAEGCRVHGFSDEEISELVDDLNQMLNDLPSRPQTLELTAEAARAVQKVAKEDAAVNRRPERKRNGGRRGNGASIGLSVVADASGGFCMEFRQKPCDGDRTFENPEEPGVRIFASPLTLRRIGGAVIDFREGRFTLDLPEDDVQFCRNCLENSAVCCCKTGQIAK